MYRILGAQTIVNAITRISRGSAGEFPLLLHLSNGSRRILHMQGCLRNPTWVKMPSLSPTMTEGSIVQWSKKEGEEVQSGDVLCEVQTDKAVVALECEDDGVLAKILVTEKTPNVQVGSMIAVLANPDENWEEVAKSAALPSDAAQKVPDQTPAKPELSAASSPAAPPSTTATKVGPAARLLLDSYGLDSSRIPASGPRGSLLKEDVLGYIRSHPVSAEPSAPVSAAQPPSSSSTLATTSFIDVPLSNMRQTIAKRLTMSKTTIPHAYVRSTARLDQVMELRKMIKSRLGIKLSVNDIIIKACALGLRLVPQLNAITDATSACLQVQRSVDICMAVATPAGLITPILCDVDCMPISELASLSSSLAKKARDGKLQPHEFQGGSFTISNLGMFGIREFTAIINPPQVAILAVGSGLPRPMDILDTGGLQSIKFANTLTLTLSIDSRYIDEAVAGRFLTHVSRLLTDHPRLLLTDDLTIFPKLDGQLMEPDQFDNLLLSTTSASSAGSPKTSSVTK